MPLTKAGDVLNNILQVTCDPLLECKVFTAWGILTYRQKYFLLAEEAFKASLLYPGNRFNTASLYWLAKISLFKNELPQAMQYLEHALTLNSNHDNCLLPVKIKASIYRTLMQVYLRQKNGTLYCLFQDRLHKLYEEPIRLKYEFNEESAQQARALISSHLII